MLKKILLLIILLPGIYVPALAQHHSFNAVQLTFEKDLATSEDTVFQSLNSIRYEGNAHASSGYYSGLLSTLFTAKTQSVPLAVHKGDYLMLEAYAHYEKASNKKLLKKLALAIGVGMAASQLDKRVLKEEGEEMKAADRLVPLAAGGAIAIPALARQLRGKPKATIRWELYDRERQLISRGGIDVDRDAKNNWQHISHPIQVINDGYLIIYLTNHSKTPVWFDEVALRKAEKPEPGSEEKKADFHEISIIAMTSNMDGGCGEDDDEECYHCGCAEYAAENECECTYSYCDEDPDPCATDPTSCECDAMSCEEDACDVNPYSCDCSDYASSHPTECGGGYDPCSYNPYSCDCDPAYCNNDPCMTNPFSCDCNPAYCESDPCDTNPFSCECNPVYCAPDPCVTNPASCACNPANCPPCTTCACDATLCPPGGGNPQDCGVSSASLVIAGNNAPGETITITTLLGSTGNPTITGYTLEVFYSNRWWENPDGAVLTAQTQFIIRVLGNLKFRVTVTYTCNGGSERSIVSSENNFTARFCHTDLTTRYNGDMNTCWTNTVNASLPATGQHEYGFNVDFDGSATPPSYTVQNFNVTVACGAAATHADSYSVPNGADPFQGDAWRVGGFHTHPPLTHCPANHSRTPGPSTIDNANNADFPRIVKDYCSGPVQGGHAINLATCNYNYGPTCTTY